MSGTVYSPGDRCGSREKPTRRIIVYFEGVIPDDRIVLEYSATYMEACEFVAAAVRNGLDVTVDRQLRPGLRPLPCRSLWHH